VKFKRYFLITRRDRRFKGDVFIANKVDSEKSQLGIAKVMEVSGLNWEKE
jgi:hypothetical protein